MNIKFGVLLFLMIVFMLVLPTLAYLFLDRKQKLLKIVTIIFSVIYFVLLFIVTIATFNYQNGIVSMTINFDSGWFSLFYEPFNLGITNVLINLFMMFPVGFVVYILFPKHAFLKTVLVSALIGVLIELYQFILPVYRNTEIIDIILNGTSGLISALYLELLNKIKHKKVRYENN